MRSNERNSVVRAALALALLAGAAQAFQKPEPRVSAQLSTGVARLGEDVGVTIVLENSRDGSIVEIPSVEGLELGRPSGPGVYEFHNFVNGRVTQGVQLSWHVAVRPAEVGEFVIPGFVLEVDGKKLTTQPLRLKVVRDIRGEDLGFLEVHASSQKVVEGQPFTLELRFGWDAASRFNYGVLSLPWWDALPGAIELDAGERLQNAQRFIVNDGIEVMAEELGGSADGRRSFRITRTYLPVRSGELEFPTSFLEFGRFERNRRSLFGGDAKTESHFVRAEPFTLEVVSLPIKGQPLDFSGAVGSLEVHASADTRDVVVGDSIKLTVDWTGKGNLEFFQAPDLSLSDAFEGFRVYGTTEDKSFERRRVTYDVAPLSAEVTEIPAVPLTVFDPEREEYTTIASDPIPIRVRPLERPVTLGDEETERFERDILDIDARPLGEGSARRPGPDGRWVIAALVGLPILWLGARTGVRRRRGDPDAPLERRRRRARRKLARALAAQPDPPAQLAAFQAFLAARSREPAEAWIGRELSERGGGDVPADVLAAGERLRERLEQAVYGGGAPVDPREVLETAERLARGGF